MLLTFKKYVLVLLFVLICTETECRKSGRSRASSRGSSRNRQTPKTPTSYDPVHLSYSPYEHSKPKKEPSVPKQTVQKSTAPVPSPSHDASKPSAPKPADNNGFDTVNKQHISPQNDAKPAGNIGFESVNKQQVSQQNSASPSGNIGFDAVNKQQTPQSSPNAQRPIGWNVGQGTQSEGNINKNAGWNVGSSNTNYQPPPVGSYPSNTASSNHYGTGSNYNYGNNNPYNPNQPGHYQASNVGGMPPQGANTGHYYNHANGMGNAPPYGNHYPGGYGGYGGHSGGFGGYGGSPGGFGGGYGGGLGGFGGGLGGYGGFGGMGGYGGRKSGFSIGTALQGALAGLLIWNLVKSGSSERYVVHNYYNKPQEVPQEITLPPNVIQLCPENATLLCVPNTVPLCTSNSTIMCVVTLSETMPCGKDLSLPCVNSTIPCPDEKNPDCSNITSDTNGTSISVPCIANATVLGNNSDTNSKVYCVTTLATPVPEEPATMQNATIPCSMNSTEPSQDKDGTVSCSVSSTSVPVLSDADLTVAPLPVKINDTSVDKTRK